MKKKYFIGGLVLIVLIAVAVFLGSPQKIVDIKNEKHLGQQVKVSGTVTNVLKIGQLSGYKIVDKTGNEIAVSAKKLPKEGDQATIKGILMKEVLIGYYIQTKE